MRDLSGGAVPDGNGPAQGDQMTDTESAVYVSGVWAHRPTGRSFVTIDGGQNVTIADCTIFGPDPSVWTLLRSWWRRRPTIRSVVRIITTSVVVGGFLGACYDEIKRGSNERS